MVGTGSGSSAIVTEQSALIAKGGGLTATVAGNTDLKGGVIAALDAGGKDSGKLMLSTGTLSASDIKDSAKSTDISVGISASINNVTDKNTRGANLPVIDGSYSSTIYKQDNKATIGQGVVSVAVPDANVTINRDIGAAQVVTKDSQTGFTVYADVAAAKELVNLVKGAAGDSEAAKSSVILQGVAAVKSLSDNKVDSSPLDKSVSDVFRIIAGRSAAAEADARSVAADKRFANADGSMRSEVARQN